MAAARVLRDAEADVQPGRRRMAADARREHVDGVVVGAQAQQVVAPVEEVLFGRRQVRGALVADGGRDVVARPRVHVAEQVEQLGGLLRLEHPPHLLARGVQRAGLQVGEGEVVAVGVVGRVERARALEMRDGGCELAGLEVELAERVVRVEGVGRAAHGLDEAALDRRRVGRGRGARGLRRRRRVAACGARALAEDGEDERTTAEGGTESIHAGSGAIRILSGGAGPVDVSATSRTSSRPASGAACCACW